MSATPPDIGQQAALNGAAAREVSTAAASNATATPSQGAAPRRLGLALAVIATAQLMVVLDATIVNVAVPHIQTALGFSGTNLEWVVNAYALAFGGLLLLGGRSGDLLGRRRVFIAGILVFTLASLLGGFATDQEWLLTARVLQGIGGAFAAPTALSLIAVTFPEGPPRNRAMGVYAGMSVAGGAVGLLASGVLLTYLNWRWVFFVNVPIGLAVALLAPRVLGESERQRGRFDLPGAITGSLGLAALVYGLSSAATTPNGVSHWGDTKVIVSLVAAAVLLVAFGFIEVRSKYALLPIRVLRSRDRSGAYLVSLCVGTALFGMFFFLTLFVQNVLGYSPLRTGVAYLPMVGMILVATAAASQLVSRIGARPLMIAGSAASAGGMFWLSRVTGRRKPRRVVIQELQTGRQRGPPPAIPSGSLQQLESYAVHECRFQCPVRCHGKAGQPGVWAIHRFRAGPPGGFGVKAVLLAVAEALSALPCARARLAQS